MSQHQNTIPSDLERLLETEHRDHEEFIPLGSRFSRPMACRLVPWLSLSTLASSVLRHASTEFTGAGLLL